VIREMFRAALEDPGTRVPFGMADALARRLEDAC
jgi:hypothetical protein